MKKLLILLPFTLLSKALYTQFLKAAYKEINYTDFKCVAKQFFAHNCYLAGSLPGVTKLADVVFR